MSVRRLAPPEVQPKDFAFSKDNLAWAYAELHLATTNQIFHNLLRAYYTPGDPNTCHWSWWHMDQGYGRAVRAYAFAAKNGRAWLPDGVNGRIIMVP